MVWTPIGTLNTQPFASRFLAEKPQKRLLLAPGLEHYISRVHNLWLWLELFTYICTPSPERSDLNWTSLSLSSGSPINTWWKCEILTYLFDYAGTQKWADRQEHWEQKKGPHVGKPDEQVKEAEQERERNCLIHHIFPSVLLESLFFSAFFFHSFI